LGRLGGRECCVSLPIPNLERSRRAHEEEGSGILGAGGDEALDVQASADAVERVGARGLMRVERTRPVRAAARPWAKARTGGEGWEAGRGRERCDGTSRSGGGGDGSGQRGEEIGFRE